MLHDSKTGFEFFQSRCCVPQNRKFPFFQSLRHAFQKAALSIFEKPALHAWMPPTAVWNLFFKNRLWRHQIFQNRRFALEYRLRRFQYFQSRRFTPQKRGLNFCKVGAAFLKTRSFHFSKAGATRFNKRHFQFFKSRRFTPQCRLRLYFFFKNGLWRH